MKRRHVDASILSQSSMTRLLSIEIAAAATAVRGTGAVR